MTVRDTLLINARSSLCGILLLFCADLKADKDDLFSLNLEELLQVKVVSKSSEIHTEAPGVVSVITDADIRRFGARNLRDVFDRLVNTQVIGSNLFPHNRVSIRGVTQTHTDNKILLLLNGRVIRDGNQGGINTDIYNLFPVQLVRKIEIIRGPGSVIYGTNAFSGVINIITYQGDENIQQINLSAGSFDAYTGNGLFSISSDKYQLTGGLAYSDKDNASFADWQGEFGSTGTYPMDQRGYQLFLSGRVKDLSFNLLHSDANQGHVKSLFQFPSSTLAIARTHLDIGYHYEFADNWQLVTHLTHNEHEVAFDISNTRATQTDSQDTIFEATLTGKRDSLELISGITYEEISGTLGNDSTNPTPFKTDTRAFYTQLGWFIDASNKLVAGFQINNPQNQSSATSPRFAFIHHFDASWTLKALYGEAYRSPFGTDLFLNSPSLQGNPDLKPETIKTIDLQLIRQTADSFSAMTVYRSRHKDLHQRVLINNIPTFTNQGQVDYYGVELEYRRALNPSLEIIGNASFQQNENEHGLEQVTYNPETMFKLGVSYSNSRGFNFGVYENYFSAATNPFDLDLAPTAINPDAKAYHLVTVNAEFDLTTLWQLNSEFKPRLSLYIDNLLDEKIYFPSINRTNVNTLPHHNGRGAYLTLSVDF